MKLQIRTIILLLCLLVAVITSNGQSVNHAWSKSIGSTGPDEGTALTVDAAGNVYATGLFSGTCDFDPGPGVSNLTSNGGQDVFISKTDALGNFIWAKHVGGTGGEIVSGIAVDGFGNVHITGAFDGTVDFDPGPSIANLNSGGAFVFDVFVLKLDPFGNYMWAKSFTGNGYAFPSSISIDPVGNVITTGAFIGTYDFDPGPGTSSLTPNGFFDSFISKIDASGNFIWVKGIGNGPAIETKSVTIDGTGNIYLTGYFEISVDFDPGPAVANIVSVGGADIFVSKFDALGNLVWVKTMGGTGYDVGLSIVVDQLGNILTTGSFSGTADLNPEASVNNFTSNGDDDIFISKLDAFGNFVWAKGLGGTGYDKGTSITTDNSGNAYLTGDFAGTMDFDPGASTFELSNLSASTSSAFILKLDQAGTFYWARNIAEPLTSSSNTAGLSLKVHSTGSIYTTGRYNGTSDFDPNSTVFNLASLGTDIFLQRLDQNSCGAPTLPYLNLSITSCDSFGIFGYKYVSSGTYYPVTASNIGCDSIVVLNLTINYATSSSQSFTACDSFSYNGNVYTTGGMHLDTFTNAVGCDSVVSLQLTLLHSVFDTLVHSACDSFVLNGTSYYSTGFYNQNYTSANGCDSVVVLDLTILNSIDTLPQTSCKFFVYNGNTYTSSGYFSHVFPSVNSCDSIVVLNLTINTVDVTVSSTATALAAGATGATYQWLDCNGFSPIAGETSQSFVFTQPGSYAVAVTQNGCTDTSICLLVTDIGDVNGSDGMRLFPNPSDGNLAIEVSSQLRDAVVRVVDVSGRLVQSFEKVRGNKVLFNLKSLSSGMYVIEIIDGETVKRARFQKL